MINGKFFTGLPEKMMDKSGGPNRQKTNFYWPDESITESFSKTKLKHQNQKDEKPITNFSESPSTSHIKSKDLFKKHLSSKIQFYDTVENYMPTPTKNDLARSKVKETFASKIEFYDFVDTQNTVMPKTDKNSKKDLERNSKNSPKTKDKKIKFIERENKDVESTSTKSILKNNEALIKTKTAQTDLTNKKIFTKKNMSKSVDNLSRSKSVGDFTNENIVQIIENDVKNLSLSKQNTSNEYDENERPQRSRPHENSIKSISNNTESSCEKQVTRSLNCAKQTNWEDDPRNDVEIGKLNTSSNTKDNEDTKKGGRPKLRENELKDDTIESQNTSSFISLPFSPTSKKNANRLNEIKVSKSPHLTETNTNRAHRHLVSNISSILFGGNDNDNETTSNRVQKMARNSAVTRVSVGLPD